MVADIDECDFATEAAEHLSELEADITGAENKEMLRVFRQIHDGGVSKVWRLRQPLNIRSDRTRTGIYENSVAFELLAVDAQFVRCDEAGMAAIQTKVFGALANFVFLPRAPIVHVAILALYDFLHVDPHLACVYPPFPAVADIVCHLRRRDHCLGRRTSRIDAGAADLRPLYQRDAPSDVRQILGQRIPGLPRANYDRVILSHGSSVSLSFSRRRRRES